MGMVIFFPSAPLRAAPFGFVRLRSVRRPSARFRGPCLSYYFCFGALYPFSARSRRQKKAPLGIQRGFQII